MTPKTINNLPLILWNLLTFMLITAKLLTETNAFSLNLIRIDSIDPPLFPKNITKEERQKKLSQLTIAPVHHLRTMAAATSDTTALRPPVYRALSNVYVTQMRIGSQNYSPYLMIDSGSDDTWVQCEGCKTCFEIKGGSFKFQSSSTFRYLPCDHPLCVPKLCQSGHCVYDIRYLGSTAVRCVVSSDTFSFPTNYTSIPNVVFGCGFDNKNINFGENRGPNNIIAGFFGLGYGKRSILRQLDSQTNGLFSYCLPSWTRQLNTSTYLRFGNDAKIVGEAQRGVQEVRMVTGIDRYMVTLVDISVNGKRLRLNPAMFRGKLGIDSGAAYTALSLWPKMRIQL